MRPDERDAAHLWDMLDTAKTIRDFVAGGSFYNCLQDKKLQLHLKTKVIASADCPREFIS
jgi:hypothetical protein